MSFEESLSATVADAVSEAIAPLVARIAELERLLTATGGDRPTDLLDKGQVAKRLGVSTRSVERYVTSGQLHKPVTVGGGLKRWRVKDVEDFLRRAS